MHLLLPTPRIHKDSSTMVNSEHFDGVINYLVDYSVASPYDLAQPVVAEFGDNPPQPRQRFKAFHSTNQPFRHE